MLARGGVVSAEQLLDIVWRERPVGIESLNRCISTLRGKLGAAGDLIETHHRRGYRLASASERDALARTTAANALVQQATEYLGVRTSENLQAGIDLLDKALVIDPKCVPALRTICLIEVLRAGRRHVAPKVAAAAGLRAADAILAQAPDDAEALASRGLFRCMVFGETDGLEDLERAISLNGDSWFIRLFRGNALASLGRLEESVPDLRLASLMNPGAPTPPSILGAVLLGLGRIEEARELLQRATISMPYYDGPYSFLAAAESCRGDHDAAIAAAQKSVELAHGLSFARAALAHALALAGRVSEAKAEIERIRAQDPPPASLFAPVLWEIEGEQSARAMFEQAEIEGCPFRRLVPQDPRMAKFL
jgi:DNA-binding winged helix-turn-helix (wHTH) protein/Flp pilus assembly protein TadD